MYIYAQIVFFFFERFDIVVKESAYLSVGLTSTFDSYGRRVSMWINSPCDFQNTKFSHPWKREVSVSRQTGDRSFVSVHLLYLLQLKNRKFIPDLACVWDHLLCSLCFPVCNFFFHPQTRYVHFLQHWFRFVPAKIKIFYFEMYFLTVLHFWVFYVLLMDKVDEIHLQKRKFIVNTYKNVYKRVFLFLFHEKFPVLHNRFVLSGKFQIGNFLCEKVCWIFWTWIENVKCVAHLLHSNEFIFYIYNIFISVWLRSILCSYDTMVCGEKNR